MALITDGAGGTGVAAVSPNQKALAVTPRPLDPDTLGFYSLGVSTGVLAAATTGEIFQFRWTDATRLAVIRKVIVSAGVSTTYFAAGVPEQLDIIKATAWSAQGTGGTGITLAATCKTRTSFGSSLAAAGDIRIATTAALGAGTKTAEANSLASVVAACPITASVQGLILPPVDVLSISPGDGDYPLVLATNEGFTVNIVALPGTGTHKVGVRVEWAEVASY
jgi:hypothetical protein